MFRSGVDVLLTPSSVSDARTYKDFVARDNRQQQEVEDVMFMSANLAGESPLSTVHTSWECDTNFDATWLFSHGIFPGC